MKKTLNLILTLFAMTLTNNITAQSNLVPNPSFEIIDSCPIGTGGLSNAVGWESFAYDPDLFSPCANLNTPYIGVPNNFGGYQVAKDGNNYAGLVTYTNALPFREYLGIELINPLIKDSIYYISAFISKADSINDKCSTNKFGFRFSNIHYTSVNKLLPDNFSHYHTDSIISEKNNWVLIQGSFIADSSYRYFIIGNFYDDLHTDTFDCYNGSLFEAYYYVDALCVSTDSTYSRNWTNISENINDDLKINLFPNPANNDLYIKSSNKLSGVDVFDILGKKIYCDFRKNNDSFILDTSHLKNDIYFIVLNKEIYRKIIVSH